MGTSGPLVLPSPHRGAAERRAESTGVFWGCPRSRWKDVQGGPRLRQKGSTEKCGQGYLGRGQGKRRGQDCSVSGRASPWPGSAALPSAQPLAAASSAIHPPPHRGGLLLGPLLSSAPHKPLYLGGSGEGVGPYAGVSPRPLSTQQS